MFIETPKKLWIAAWMPLPRRWRPVPDYSTQLFMTSWNEVAILQVVLTPFENNCPAGPQITDSRFTSSLIPDVPCPNEPCSTPQNEMECTQSLITRKHNHKKHSGLLLQCHGLNRNFFCYSGKHGSSPNGATRFCAIFRGNALLNKCKQPKAALHTWGTRLESGMLGSRPF